MTRPKMTIIEFTCKDGTIKHVGFGYSEKHSEFYFGNFEGIYIGSGENPLMEKLLEDKNFHTYAEVTPQEGDYIVRCGYYICTRILWQDEAYKIRYLKVYKDVKHLDNVFINDADSGEFHDELYNLIYDHAGMFNGDIFEVTREEFFKLNTPVIEAGFYE